MSASYLLDHKAAGSHSDAVWSVICAVLPDGTEVVITGSNDHSVRFWKKGLPYKTILSKFGIVSLAVDSTSSATFLVSSSIDSVLTRYDMQGDEEAKLKLGAGESWNVVIHPKTFNLATAGGNEGVKVRVMNSDVEGFGKEIVSLKGRGTFGTALQYSKDGSFLACASDTGYVSLWNGNNFDLLSTFPAHAATIRSITFTTNLIITGSDDKRINVFDLQALSSQKSGRSGQVATLGGHEGWVTALATRNDRLLASGSSDGLIKLWDLTNLGASAISTLRDHVGDVWCLSFAVDSESAMLEGLGGASSGIVGGRLVSAGEDSDIRWWRG